MPIEADTTKRSVLLAVLPHLLIAVFAWVGYFNSLDVPFTFDDESNISKNPSVLITDLSPGSLVEAAFGSSHPTPRPVAYLTFGLNHYFGQLDVFGYHIVNIVIHTINGWLVFVLALHLCPLLIRRTKETPRSTHVFFALAVALLFISHPVQTQAVTYIVQRMTSLCTLFYLAGLLCYFRGRGIEASALRLRIAWWSLAFVCWVLALGTKQFAVTLPLVIMLYEWVARGERIKLQKKTVAIVGAGAVLMVLVVAVFKGGMGSRGGTLITLLTSGYDNRDFTLTERLMTEARVVTHYISLLAWPPPSRLVLDYDYPISTSLVSPITTIWSILGLGAMTVASALFVRRLPLVAFGVLWFMLHLAVESTIIPLEIAYEHRLYMPIIGAGLLFVGGVFVLIKNPKAAFAVVLVISSVMLVGTHQRNETWRSALGIWQDNAEKQPTEPRAYFNMAVIHKDMAVVHAVNDQHDEARKQYNKAIDLLWKTKELEPRHQEAWVRIGAILKLVGRYQESANVYTTAIDFDRDEHPRFARFHWDAYTQRASLLDFVGKYHLAAQDYTSALELPPLKNETEAVQTMHTTEARAGRGLAYMNLEMFHEAIADFEAALVLNPDHMQANNNLAWILSTTPDPELLDGKRAVGLAKKACELTNWEELATLSTYAASLAEAGDFAEAIRWQITCIRLAPPPVVEMYRARLELFQNNTPYRSE